MVVIDDGSCDGTAEIARAAGAVCLESRTNSGKAAALRIGIAYARAQLFTHVITLDGDGQHLPEDIPTMLSVADESGADLVIGTRVFQRADMPPRATTPIPSAVGWPQPWLAAKSGTARVDFAFCGWINSAKIACVAVAMNLRWKF